MLAQFKEKRFRYGTFSTAMMLGAVVLFVLANLVSGVFDHTWDLTDDGLLTLSPQSVAFLASLEQDVSLTLIIPAGTADEPRLTALLDEYANSSTFINVSQRDPILSPAFLQGFDAGFGAGVIPNHSIIVQSGARYRVVTPDTLFTPRFNMQGQVVGIASINFERQITTAIHAVTLGETAIVYKVLGSGEAPLDAAFVSFLQTENFVVRELQAMDILRDGVPAHADILLLSTPARDWPADKADAILAFLEDEGRAFIAADPQFGGRLPHFDRVLAAYGLRVSDYFVMDPDPRMHVGIPPFLLPQLFPHEVNLPLVAEGRGNIMTRFTAAIEPAAFIRATTQIEPLLFTSGTAFGRVDPALESFAFHEEVDYAGPFMVAVGITDAIFTYRTLTTQLVLVGSSDIWNAPPREVVGDNNYLWVASALRWLTGQDAGLFIPVQTPGVWPLEMNQRQANTVSGLVMGILPLALIATGVVIWQKRRRR